MRSLSFLPILLSLSLFTGVASGQGRYDLPEQGQQPLQSGMKNWEQPSLGGSLKDGKTNSKPVIKKVKGAGLKKRKTGTIPTPGIHESASQQDGMKRAKKSQFGSSKTGLIGMGYNQPGNPGSTSFLDGYLLKSMHSDGLARKRTRSEEKPTNNLSPQGKTTTSKF